METSNHWKHEHGCPELAKQSSEKSGPRTADDSVYDWAPCARLFVGTEVDRRNYLNFWRVRLLHTPPNHKTKSADSTTTQQYRAHPSIPSKSIGKFVQSKSLHLQHRRDCLLSNYSNSRRGKSLNAAIMATETMTVLEPGRRRLTKDETAKLAPENERYMRACSDIASALIQEHEAQQDPTKPKKDVNLNSLRSKMSKKHRLSNIPPLTAIIAAIPEHYKKYILPKLIAKPISMIQSP